MDTLPELQTIEAIDIWNEEFGGIDIDWSVFDALLVGKDDGDANNNGKQLMGKEKNLKAKRGRPRLKPLKPEALSLRRDVSNADCIPCIKFHLQAANARERRRNDRLLTAYHR